MAIKTYTDRYSGFRHWFKDPEEVIRKGKDINGHDFIIYRKDLEQLIAEGKEEYGKSSGTKIVPVEPVV